MLRCCAVLVVSMVVWSGASAQPANLPTTPESVALVDMLNDYEADRRSLGEFYPMSFDEPSLGRLGQLQEEYQQQLAAVSFDALDRQGQIDYLLFRTHLEAQLGELALSRRRLEEMRSLIPFAETVAALERARVAMEPLDYAATAALLDALGGEIEALRERIEAGRKERDGDSDDGARQSAESEGAEHEPIVVSPVLANRTAGMVREIGRTLDHWYEHRDGFEPEFGWWMRSPHEKASKALEEYAKFLAENVAGIKGEDDDPMIGDPIGREKLLADLCAEWIPYSPEELIEIAEREFAWCEGEMLAATREMGFGDDWKAALEKVKRAYVPPGEQDDLVAELAQEAVDYLRANELVTIPPLCEELWRLEMIPPRNQRFWPFAFYGGNHMAVAYPTPEMSHEDKLMSMRGNNRHFTRAIVHHELIPGHHLQGFMAARERPYRRMFSTPFLVEGWALYWEMVLYDKGFPRSPEDRVGMLFWRMHRCARIIVSLEFHLGEMSPQEMVDFLVDRVGHERFGATSEVRRYVGDQYSPLYQCGYMIGGLQLRALRAEVLGPGGVAEREFHDSVLRQGPIPIELIRAALLEQSLELEQVSAWRFGG